jgi:eukaryotic-like serine/threonine-protein kinase
MVKDLFLEVSMSMIGKTLAHYEITSQLGKGGMGEVYQAKDRKLGRDVAIKVLPEEFARDADRVARFQREAKLLASLNHTNIAAIHGLEESDGTNFLVLELVEGDTLADRIKRGPIAVEESLKLALQITEALEAAHEKGVIHRDLKPANIKVTPDGKVKVLDFGLAKAFAGEQSDLNLSNSPTLTRSPTLSDAATQQGVILGTAAYMSPEQAKGKSVDKRADIWAFGVVLFEMLTGRSLFAGDDVSQTLARVLERQPDFSALPPNLHSRIRLLLERCLEKEAKNRYGSISDARVDIQNALADPSGVLMQPVTVAEPRTKLRTILPWAAAAIVLGAIIAGVAVWNLRKPESHQLIRLDYDLPENQQFNTSSGRDCLAISPDGRQIAYSTRDGIFLRAMDELTARIIPGTETNPHSPFFSPDGKWLGYLSLDDNKLKKIAISGGAPIDLCDARRMLGASWDAADTIVYAEEGDVEYRGIIRISANGGSPEKLIELKKYENFYYPRLLPDGKSVIFTLGPPPYKIAVQSLESRERKVLFPGDTAWYLPTGHIVYALGNNLFAVPFHLDTFQISGGPVLMIEGVFRTSALYPPSYAVSGPGTLVYMPETIGAATTKRNLAWVDMKGKEELLAAPSNAYRDARISPDGKRVALSMTTASNENIWIWDLIRESLTRLTSDASRDLYPLWTRDGKRIFFASQRSGWFGVYWKAADGTGGVEQLSVTPIIGHCYPYAWSADGNNLILIQNISNNNIGAVSMEGERKWRPLLKEKYNEAQPQISPDGKWMAYVSDESGRNEVYVRPFPGVEGGGRWQVSTDHGDSPLWSPDGRELFYRNDDSSMVVQVETEPTFSPEKPKVLFKGTYLNWDISPDGKRFLMIKPPASAGAASAAAGPRKINVVVNWFEELKQRVPVK